MRVWLRWLRTSPITPSSPMDSALTARGASTATPVFDPCATQITTCSSATRPTHLSSGVCPLRASDKGRQVHWASPFTISAGPSHWTVQSLAAAKASMSVCHASAFSTVHRPPSGHRVAHADTGMPCWRKTASTREAFMGVSQPCPAHHVGGTLRPSGPKAALRLERSGPAPCVVSRQTTQPSAFNAHPVAVRTNVAPSSPSRQCFDISPGSSRHISRADGLPHNQPPRQDCCAHPKAALATWTQHAKPPTRQPQTSAPTSFQAIRSMHIVKQPLRDSLASTSSNRPKPKAWDSPSRSPSWEKCDETTRRREPLSRQSKGGSMTAWAEVRRFCHEIRTQLLRAFNAVSNDSRKAKCSGRPSVGSSSSRSWAK